MKSVAELEAECLAVAKEAADEIDSLRAALAAKDAEIETITHECELWVERYESERAENAKMRADTELNGRLITTALELRNEARAELAKLRELLRRHDELCRKDEDVGNNYVWTPELEQLVADTRATLAAGEGGGT